MAEATMKERRKMGRHTKLTPELQVTILDCLRNGNTVKDTCSFVDVSQPTFYDWCNRNPTFLSAIKEAEASAVVDSVSRIRQAAIGGQLKKRTTTRVESPNGFVRETTVEEYTEPQWTADAWFLERRYPEDWGRRDVLKFEMQQLIQKTRQQAEAEGLDPNEAVAAAEAMLREMGVPESALAKAFK